MLPGQEGTKKIGYRADIDGLRAVAVLLVLLDHLRTRVQGGYVGVDVFFVISGYLISTAIMADLNRGRFSIVAFYERRVRRIAPALLAMLAVTTVFAYRYFMPSDFVAYAGSLLAALLSCSNMLFWKQTGYFDAPSSFKPLLHTWSLAVEEQFYVVFPLVLMAVWKWTPRRMKTVIWTLTGISFALACLIVQKDPTTAFFLAPLRAWELLIGMIVSQKYLPALRSAAARNIASALGIILILLPAFGYTATTRFPGMTAVPPCIGAALLIAAGEHGSSWVGRALSWRPVVFVGLISYSLYLWHWPIMVFQQTNSILLVASDGQKKREQIAELAVSLIVGTLSWWLIETPFRQGQFRPGRKAVFALAGMGAAILLIAGMGVEVTRGLPSRFTPEELSISKIAKYNPMTEFRGGVCFVATPDLLDKSKCFPPRDGRKQYLLLGDSTAAELYSGLTKEFPEVQFSQATTWICPPLRDPSVLAPIDNEWKRCKANSDFWFGDLLTQYHPDKVLLAGSWIAEVLPELGRTLKWLTDRGYQVVLFGPAIKFNAPVPKLLFAGLRSGRMDGLDQHWNESNHALNATMKRMAATEWHVSYISEFDDLCRKDVVASTKEPFATTHGCPMLAGPGVPMKGDEYHLTMPGVDLFARQMRARHELP
jgi:peptidoglycan/LPS O-acetylase OafA/YrhL